MIRNFFTALLFVATTQVSAQQKIEAEAHRGGRGLMPENTIEAMIWAVKQGVQTLEMDLVISKDGKVVVSHDNYMASDFMLKPEGGEITKEEEKSLLLYGMDYQLIRRYDAGTKIHPQFPDQKKFKTYKPLFSELIDSVETYVKIHNLKPVYYNVEIKSSPAGDQIAHPDPATFVHKVLTVLNEKKLTDRTIIQSFDVRPLQILHQQVPTQKLSFLIANKDNFETNIKNLGFNPYALSPYFILVTAELVKEAHAKNIVVVPWTVNTVSDIKKMANLNVDGIISDFPNLIIELYGSYQMKK